MLARGAGKALIVLAAFVSLIVLAPSVSALDSKARIVRLSYTEGEVQADRGQGYYKAVMNMPISEGMRLWTHDANGYAEVELEDGSSIRLAPDTIVEFRELGLRGSGERVSTVELNQGTAYVEVRGHAGQFRIISAGQEFTADRNSHFRIESGKEQVRVAVYNGDVQAHSGTYEVKIKKNETFTLDLNDAARYYLAKGIGEEQFDNFDQQREEYRTAYSANNNLVYSGYSSNYQYGISDLSYYGSYFYAPGWGYLWRPFGVGLGWNPFMDGAWMWYPGYGYLWISSYPWGWMPYRYGAWNFVPAYGWCWAPATSWNTWSSLTPVRRPPHGFVPLRPPTTPPATASRGIVEVGHGTTTLFPSRSIRSGAVGNMVGPKAVVPYGMPSAGIRSGPGSVRTGEISRSSVTRGSAGAGQVSAPTVSGGARVGGVSGHVGGVSGGRR